MKTGDLVVATRKGDVIFSASSGEDRYFGIFIKEEYGDKFVESRAPTMIYPEHWKKVCKE